MVIGYAFEKIVAWYVSRRHDSPPTDVRIAAEVRRLIRRYAAREEFGKQIRQFPKEQFE